LKVDAEILTGELVDIPRLAKKAEEFGFDCVWANETKHDPFVQLALAAPSTSSVSLGTSIALAFTRSPTTIAYAAWDLQNVTDGRFILGLGSQVKGHIERRFGMKWESPEPKMREVIVALRSIWRCWQSGERLDVHGRFFNIDLMTPFFNPGPIAHPSIPVYVAGVNRRMFRLAGQEADGLHVHPLHTERYLKEVMKPEVARGLAASKRLRKDISIAASIFAAVGDDEAQVKSVREAYRSQIAFYASTRTYRGLMEFHGWGDVCDRLHQHSVKGEWNKMGAEINEDILDEFVVEGTWDEVGRRIKDRYGDTVDRARLYLPFDGSPGWKAMVAGFRG
jgi:probable F420-dependent oxidoreductase